MEMPYRRLGKAGIKVSEVSLGSWLTFGGTVDRKIAKACVHTALEHGINLIDTADVYAQGESERVLGQVLTDIPRKDFVLTSKVYFPTGNGPNDRGLSRKHIYESVHASLRRLRTDYLDIYQCHRFDTETPLDETLRAMDDLVRHGKILYWGVSHWPAEKIADACDLADKGGLYAPSSNQPPYSLLERAVEREVLPVCRRYGLGVIVFSPLCQGILTGKYRGGRRPEGTRGAHQGASAFMAPYFNEHNLAATDAMCALARDLSMTPSQLALAWCLRLAEIASVIIGATSPEQVAENAGAAGRNLGADVLARIETIFAGAGPHP